MTEASRLWNRVGLRRTRSQIRIGVALAQVLLFCLFLAPAAAQVPEESEATSLAAADEAVRGEMERQGLVGLAIGIARGDQILALKGYGWQDRESRIPVRARRTMFRWASISKTLTGIAALKLANAGEVDLDRPISAYLTEYRPPATYVESCDSGEKAFGDVTVPCRDGFFEVPIPEARRIVTTRRLLGHLAGIAHYRNSRGIPVPPMVLANDPKTNRGFAWALEYLYDKPLVAMPGDAMRYTTFGFNLAGAVLEAAAGEPFADQVRRGISEPLGLTTLQPDYEWREIADRAVGYQRRGRGPVIDRQGSEDVSWKLPGGGFISTAADLLSYCQGLAGDELLNAEEKTSLWTEQKTSDGYPTGYGLGFVVGERDGQRLVSHSGSQQKARTLMLLFPDQGLCVVAMSNSTYADVDAITRALTAAVAR